MTYTYTNTELYNKILQAMDNYKPIFIISDSGTTQGFVSPGWNGEKIAFPINSSIVSSMVYISPSGGTVYTPTNISISSPEPS